MPTHIYTGYEWFTVIATFKIFNLIEHISVALLHNVKGDLKTQRLKLQLTKL